MGVGLIGSAMNLVVFAAPGASRAAPPLIPAGAAAPAGAVADPLPQALVLTAIVIGFGLSAFVLALAAALRRAEAGR
jgi:multicomponent Na+:H+ antiporter subunit C